MLDDKGGQLSVAEGLIRKFGKDYGKLQNSMKCRPSANAPQTQARYTLTGWLQRTITCWFRSLHLATRHFRVIRIDEGFPTYCAEKDMNGWTVDAGDVTAIVLCPNVFNKEVHDNIQLSAQPLGTILDTMVTRSINLYHEMFHLAFPDSPVMQSPDAIQWLAKKGAGHKNKKGSAPLKSWPRQKSAWKLGKYNTDGAIMCMYLALHDMAEPVAAKADLEGIKDPETYAWFGLALYMTTEGRDHQDWSTGACRDHGSPPRMVTVTKGIMGRQAQATPTPSAGQSE
ncbi:hypothetical protein DOTSEDRAFT_37590 [Lecanosticta acicola]|uniref:Uncharacterized protein n=1 Tax=Lecanosticta acicola TaxID=111012 RepID=A0AAI8YWI9_9PEZI|nr:hypothetical protein DOTSEDRAFT_37590 [Lecanosticta acicola]